MCLFIFLPSSIYKTAVCLLMVVLTSSARRRNKKKKKKTNRSTTETSYMQCSCLFHSISSLDFQNKGRPGTQRVGVPTNQPTIDAAPFTYIWKRNRISSTGFISCMAEHRIQQRNMRYAKSTKKDKNVHLRQKKNTKKKIKTKPFLKILKFLYFFSINEIFFMRRSCIDWFLVSSRAVSVRVREYIIDKNNNHHRHIFNSSKAGMVFFFVFALPL